MTARLQGECSTTELRRQAPPDGFEPPTPELTALCSAVELRGNLDLFNFLLFQHFYTITNRIENLKQTAIFLLLQSRPST